MKVLYVITKAEVGGAQVHVLDLMRGFRGEFELHLATGEKGYLTEAAEAIGVATHIVPDLIHETRPLRDARAVAQMANLLVRLRPNLVHAHTTKAGLVGRAAAFLRRVPSVFTAHSWAFSDGVSTAWKAMGIPTEWTAARIGDRIINVSEANRQLALRYGLGPARRLVTIHNGIPDSPLRARPALGTPPVIVMVARFAPQKDHQLLLGAFAQLKAPALLHLVGDGPTLEFMRPVARQMGIADRVRFLGPRDDVAEQLASAHVFALASRWEGFPLSILEGMRAGLPVVASDVGGSREAVLHGETGFLVARGDVGGFRDSLERLCADAALRSQMGNRSRFRFEQQFSINRMLDNTRRLYEDIWRERGVTRPEVRPVFEEVNHS